MEFDARLGRIILSKINGVHDTEKNILDVEGKSYFIKPINENYKVSKGGNSTVFTLHDPTDEEDDLAIKISNVYKPNRGATDWIKRKYGRFINEIYALKQVKNFTIGSNVVSIDIDGMINVEGRDFPYYVMEKADSDLGQYLLSNSENLDFQERIKLCVDIYKGINTLHWIKFLSQRYKWKNHAN